MTRNFLVVVGLIGIVISGGCMRINADEHMRKGDADMDQSLTADAIIEYRIAIKASPKRGDLHMKLADAYLRQANYTDAIAEALRAGDFLPNDVPTHVKIGNILLMARDFNGARDHAERALVVSPDNVEALLLLGNSQAGLKNFKDAVREYEDAIALSPNDGQSYVDLGSVLQAQGNRQQAEATFKKALTMASKSPLVHVAYANFLWSGGRISAAESEIKAALAIDPADIEANRAMVVFYLATNHAREAERYIRMLVRHSDTIQANLFLADYYVSLKQPDDARKVLLQIATRADGYVPANVRLAGLEASLGQYAQALERLNEILKKHPKDISSRVLHARVLREEGKSDSAIVEARAIIRDEPTSSMTWGAYLLVGEISAESDRFEEAVAAYEEVLKRDSRAMPGMIALAALYLTRNDLDKCAGYIAHALALDPKNITVRALRVRLLIAQGDKVGAANALALLRHDAPDSAMVENIVAAQQLALGNVVAARAAYLKATELSPEDVEATTGLVKIDMVGGRTKAALDRIESHLAKTPPSPNFLVLAAQTYAEVGQLPKVEESLKRAIEVAPDKMAGYSMLGIYYAKQHRLEEARQEFEELVRRNPKSISAGTMLGMVLESLNRPAEAEKRYQAVLALNPNAAIAANNLSYMYLTSSRNLDMAFQLAQTAHQESPGDAHISDTLGWAYYQRKMAAPAVRNLEESVKLDATNPNAQYHLGMAYVMAGDATSAKKALQRVIALKSGDSADAAKKAMAELEGKGQISSTIK